MSAPSAAVLSRDGCLPARRMALLASIQAKREATTEVGRLLATDLHMLERSRRTIVTGLKVLKTAALAGGVIWSLNATSRLGRGSRLMSVGIGVLSSIRTMRKLGAFFIPLIQSPPRQE
jgi:hypothetical protein